MVTTRYYQILLGQEVQKKSLDLEESQHSKERFDRGPKKRRPKREEIVKTTKQKRVKNRVILTKGMKKFKKKECCNGNKYCKEIL